MSNEQILSLPVAQEYRDLHEADPRRQVTQDTIRGPSAGGSGQDNVYLFDGVNVTLPLFGTLSAEPASHDIAQVTTIRGGARAVDFDRAGGFAIDSVSKSGTNQFTGEVSYQFQNAGMSADAHERRRVPLRADRNWIDRATSAARSSPTSLFFYGSYYRPENQRDNRGEHLRRAAGVREHAQRGLRQADVHADATRC